MRLFIAATFLLASLTQATSATGDSDYVVTPGGLRHISKVQHVPVGARIEHTADNIHVIHENGTILHTAAFDEAEVTSFRGRVPEASGWVAYSYVPYSTLGTITYFNTTWTVPPVPASDIGQTIFIFNCLEPASGASILQPVLQYGPSAAGGGSYWAAASWYVSGANSYYSTVAPVKAGQSLTGAINLTANGGLNKFSYTSAFTNVAYTNLAISNVAQLVWPTETLEVYGTTGASNYPSGNTVMSKINIHTSNTSSPAVSWKTVNDPTDSITNTVMIDGSVNAEIMIKYPG